MFVAIVVGIAIIVVVDDVKQEFLKTIASCFADSQSTHPFSGLKLVSDHEQPFSCYCNALIVNLVIFNLHGVPYN